MGWKYDLHRYKNEMQLFIEYDSVTNFQVEINSSESIKEHPRTERNRSFVCF